MDTCEELIQEITNYKFPERTLDVSKHNSDKPVDKNNHSINPLEWICMALPANPSRLVLASGEGGSAVQFKAHKNAWQLSDDNSKPADVFVIPQYF